MLKKIQKKHLIIISIIIIVLILLPEKYEVPSENNYPKKRVRYRFPNTFLGKLLGIKPKTFILIDSVVGYKDKTIFIFNYQKNIAYQFVLSEYGNSFMEIPLSAVV